jgi:hypothetical protein
MGGVVKRRGVGEVGFHVENLIRFHGSSGSEMRGWCGVVGVEKDPGAFAALRMTQKKKEHRFAEVLRLRSGRQRGITEGEKKKRRSVPRSSLGNLTPNPFQKTLTPGADAVPSPAERARVSRYSGDIEGKGNKFSLFLMGVPQSACSNDDRRRVGEANRVVSRFAETLPAN